MRKTGTADLPLHYGHTPPWLFERMSKLGGAIIEAIVLEYGTQEVLRRLADPFWFQAFACAIGFDWHSSGTTTTACAAIKYGLGDVGLYVAGGKGKAARRAPEEILKIRSLSCEPESLVRASRLAAKIDNNCVQDNYELYHHAFFFDENGNWAVVQQGLNAQNSYARRYHWYSGSVKDFVSEPHTAICGQRERAVLNLTSEANAKLRQLSIELLSERRFERYLKLPYEHQVKLTGYTKKKLLSLAQRCPANYQELVGTQGVGRATLRALALLSALIYGSHADWSDPVSYSFAHGGKDGYPYPVNRARYDRSIQILRDAIDCAKLGAKEKLAALRRLSDF